MRGVAARPGGTAGVTALALLVLAAGLAVRLTAARATFLNPDEAHHVLIGRQPTLASTVLVSRVSAHPPLLFLVLHGWRPLGESEFLLRLPSVIAATGALWLGFLWMRGAFGPAAALGGLALLSFSPSVVALSTEIRQYPLLLLGAAGALAALGRWLGEPTRGRAAGVGGWLALALLSHYSALALILAAAPVIVVALVRKRAVAEQGPVWAAVGASLVALGALLFVVHGAHVAGSETEAATRESLGTLLRESHESAASYLVRGTRGVFAYLAGRTASPVVTRTATDSLLVLFLLGLAARLAPRAGAAGPRVPALETALLLGIPFALLAGAGLAGLYPYGASRHVAVLLVPAAAGVGHGLAWLTRGRVWPIALATAVAAPLWHGTFSPVGVWNDPATQRPSAMREALASLRDRAPAGSLVFVDAQTRVLLAVYLTREGALIPGTPHGPFQEFRYAPYRVVSSRRWALTGATVGEEIRAFRRAYALAPGDRAWFLGIAWGGHHPYRATVSPEPACAHVRVFGGSHVVAPTSADGDPPVSCFVAPSG
jgi:Dolichyl-phosphate-mannose-protein mannosyltransferase